MLIWWWCSPALFFSPDICGSFLEYTLICVERVNRWKGVLFVVTFFYIRTAQWTCIMHYLVFTNNIGNQLHPLNSFPPFPLTMNNEFFTGASSRSIITETKSKFSVFKKIYNNNPPTLLDFFTSVVGPKRTPHIIR